MATQDPLLSSDNRVYIQLQVNRRTFRALVDTSANPPTGSFIYLANKAARTPRLGTTEVLPIRYGSEIINRPFELMNLPDELDDLLKPVARRQPPDVTEPDGVRARLATVLETNAAIEDNVRCRLEGSEVAISVTREQAMSMRRSTRNFVSDRWLPYVDEQVQKWLKDLVITKRTTPTTVNHPLLAVPTFDSTGGEERTTGHAQSDT
ncbi:hypothetical protein SARC_03128 [Sphaeroforma arctica JP610]|uniref:Uncharacterized protein n=1 Tax=Sphaeroforma arctica JP610 TaxID=667725 RepID=A0A0L0G6N1_9EUKA|nr:hypothetical protein SARC_03128 [Sphaeroforma arctica JP610]KNC84667.1 hypothetical protein SARC_03128 [Sphaeroforma arctica JP610]|eukprot:XP_014158569.1 hypothetical protein SARC_03128 [Sphaeroforma arctica JP610]